ncbi:MAG: FUSC family protein [Actinomycetia bacterium]|nr:FUSC family protein [Actinomycetes bacterium]
MRTPVKSALAIQAGGPDWIQGIRLAVIVGSPLFVGLALGNATAALISSLGALNVALAAPGSVWQVRLRATLFATLAMAVTLYVALVVSFSPVLSVLVLAVWGFGCSLISGLGTKWAGAGFVVGVMFILGLGLDVSAADRPITIGFFLIGSAWGVVMATFLWPLSPRRAVRESLAKTYLALGNYLEKMPHSGRERSVAYDDVASALAESYEHVIAFRRRKWGKSHLANHAASLQQTAAAIELVLGSVDKAWQEKPPSESLTQLRSKLVAACSDIAAELLGGSAFDPAELASAGKQAAHAKDAATDDVCRTGLVLMARTLTGATTRMQDNLQDLPVTEPADRVTIATIRNRLATVTDWQSTVLRHAVRVAVLLAVAQTLATLDPFDNGYWIPLTVWIVLQPDFGATLSKGIQRIVGTLLGVLIAFGIVELFAEQPYVIAGFITLFAFAIGGLGRLNYSLMVIAITPTVILMLSLAGGSADLAWIRLGSTLVGAAIALLGGYLLWPSWQRLSLARTSQQAADAANDYANDVAKGGADAAELHRRHRLAELRRSNTDAALQRMLAEPERFQVDPTLVMEFCRSLRLLVDDTTQLALTRSRREFGADHTSDFTPRPLTGTLASARKTLPAAESEKDQIALIRSDQAAVNELAARLRTALD